MSVETLRLIEERGTPMARQWIVRPLAQADIDGVVTWYQQPQPGLGSRVLDNSWPSSPRARSRHELRVVEYAWRVLGPAKTDADAPPVRDAPATSAEGEGGYCRLDPRYVTVQRITGWLMFGIVMSVWAAVFAIVVLAREDGLRWMVWALAIIGAAMAPPLIWRATGWPALSYRRYSYRIGQGGIEIRSGVLFRRVTTVPRSRVQHTDVSQGPVARRFGLGTLVVYTAGTQYARVLLPGLDYGRAVAIRDTLLPDEGADAV